MKKFFAYLFFSTSYLIASPTTLLVGAKHSSLVQASGDLPDGLVGVEYLESTGTQWIDTGIKPTSTTKAVVDTAFTKGSVLGSIIPSYYSTWFCFTGGTAATVRYYYGSISNYDYMIDKTIRHVYGISKDFEIDGSVVYISYNTLTTGTQNIYAFGRIHNGNPNDLLKGKIFSLEIYDGDDLVCDFTPVHFTNELGQSEGAMYDRVTGEIFGNEGSGSFIIGPDK